MTGTTGNVRLCGTASWDQRSIIMILAGTGMARAALAPSAREAAPDPRADSEAERQEFITDALSVGPALGESIGRPCSLHQIACIGWRSSLHLVVVVQFQQPAAICCASNDSNKPSIWDVMKTDLLERPLQSFEVESRTNKGHLLDFRERERIDSHLSGEVCLHQNTDVGLDFLPLLQQLLIEGETPGVPDRQGGQNRLCPCGPFALTSAYRRRQPDAVIDWIGHVTSPLFSRAIVCGGNS